MSLREHVRALGSWTRPRTWRLVGAALVLLFYGALWVAEQAGETSLLAPLVVVPVLVVLIAAGNLLQGWLGITRRSPQYARPPAADAGEDTPNAP